MSEEVTNLIARARKTDEIEHLGDALDLISYLVDALERSTTGTREQALNDATGAIINGGSYQDAMRAEAVGDQTAQAYYEGQHDAWAAVNELLLKDNLRPVVSDVAEDTPKPFVMRDLSSRASGLWPKESVDPARYGVTPTPEVSTGIEPVQFPPVPYPSTEES